MHEMITKQEMVLDQQIDSQSIIKLITETVYRKQSEQSTSHFYSTISPGSSQTKCSKCWVQDALRWDRTVMTLGELEKSYFKCSNKRKVDNKTAFQQKMDRLKHVQYSHRQ